MNACTTLPPASKSPAPESSAFHQCDDASCALERLIIFVDAITEDLRTANDDMHPGEAKDRAHYEVFCLLLLLAENMKVLGDAIGCIQASIAAERMAA